MESMSKETERMAMHAYAMRMVVDILRMQRLVKGQRCFFRMAARACDGFKCPGAEDVWRLLDSAMLWLDCAARMENIRFGLSFDDGPLWCRTVYEHEERKGKMQSVFLSLHVRFHLLWNALELVGGCLFHPGADAGKTLVKRMIDHMGRLQFDSPALLRVNAAMRPLQDTLEQMDCFKRPVYGGLDPARRGLHMTKDLRNRHVHGDAFVPDSDFLDDEAKGLRELHGHIAAARITLLWMQALLIDAADKSNCRMQTTVTSAETGGEREANCKFSTFLAKQHRKDFSGPRYGNGFLSFHGQEENGVIIPQ